MNHKVNRTSTASVTFQLTNDEMLSLLSGKAKAPKALKDALTDIADKKVTLTSDGITTVIQIISEDNELTQDDIPI